MLGMQDVWVVECSGCGMFETRNVGNVGWWDVGHVGCSGYGMFGVWDARDVRCLECGVFGCGMFGMWDVRDVKCWRCGMFGMCHVWDGGCLERRI